MATLFDDVYTLNGAIQNDSRLTDKPTNIYYFILYQYLAFAIGEFSQYCYKDLLDTTPFQQSINTYESDGIATSFVLTNTPPINSVFYISIDGVELEKTEYSYDSITNTVTTNFGGTDIYISAYVVGEFNDSLNLREKTILADAMTFAFVANFTNDDTQLEQLMYSGVDMFSQSQHNKVNINIEEFRRSNSFRQMIYYSYGRDMPNTINLAKRAGES